MFQKYKKETTETSEVVPHHILFLSVCLRLYVPFNNSSVIFRLKPVLSNWDKVSHSMTQLLHCTPGEDGTHHLAITSPTHY